MATNPIREMVWKYLEKRDGNLMPCQTQSVMNIGKLGCTVQTGGCKDVEPGMVLFAAIGQSIKQLNSMQRDTYGQYLATACDINVVMKAYNCGIAKAYRVVKQIEANILWGIDNYVNKNLCRGEL